MSVKIKFVELDVLKSQKPGVEEYAQKITTLEGIEAVRITVLEVDAETETLQVSIEGKDINLPKVKDKIISLGGTVHSVDEVISSKKKISSSTYLNSE